MEDATETDVGIAWEEIVIGGHKLLVCACEIANGAWELYVENSYGVRSIWFERYGSAAAALAAGRRAIADEGAAAFVDMEGFEYLLKECPATPDDQTRH
jgi:hypothetical protein